MKNTVMKRKGFTLVELIIVIAILAVLSLAAMLGYANLTSSAKETAEKANAGVVVRTLNTYNQLAGPGTKLDTVPSATELAALKLKTSAGDLVDLDLSIDQNSLSESNITIGEVLGWVKYDSGRFKLI